MTTKINRIIGKTHHTVERTKGGKYIIECFGRIPNYMEKYKRLQDLNIRFELIVPVAEPTGCCDEF